MSATKKSETVKGPLGKRIPAEEKQDLAEKLHNTYCGFCDKCACDWEKGNWILPNNERMYFLEIAEKIFAADIDPVMAVQVVSIFMEEA